MIRFLLSTLFAGVFSLVSFSQEKITPALFEKNEGLILRWNNIQSLDSTVSHIAALVSVDEKVWILYNQASSPTPGEISTTLLSFGANLSNISFIPAETENPWIGDYGPIAGYYYDNDGFNRIFSDAVYENTLYPQADLLPLTLASEFGFNYSDLPLQIDASNIQLDGIGRAYISDKILSANPSLSKNQIIQTLYTKLSLNDVIILPSIPESGGNRSEMSRLIKFIDPESLFVTSFPESTPYYALAEALSDTLSSIFNDYGKNFTVYKLMAAPVDNDQYATTAEGKIGSYTSMLVINKKVFVPQYGKEQDADALIKINQIYKGYEIYSIPAGHIAAMNGSLSRMAIAIPQEEIFRIRHSKITEAQQFQEEIWVNVFAQTWLGVDSIQVYYRIHPETEFTVLNSMGCCGGNSGYLSGFTADDTLSYYIRAYYGDLSQTLPLAAPSATFTFWFDAFASNKSGNEIQELEIYPNPVSDVIKLKYNPAEINIASWSLFNSSGKRVMFSQKPITSELKFNDLVINGLYFLILQTDKGKQIVKKVVVQK